MNKLVDIHDLTVTRSDTFSLRIDDLSLAGGSITCVTGPNGSGKTTLLDCLGGTLRPNTGRVTVDTMTINEEMWHVRRHIGIAPDDEAWFIGELTAREYLSLLARTYTQAGVTSDMIGNVRDMAAALYFSSFDQQLTGLSHGNKKKVQIMAALMHTPSLIIVDELRNGLDPLAIQAAETLLISHARRGACIVASTHDLWWAERIAETIILIIDGVMVAHDKTTAIVQDYGTVEQLFMHHAKASYARTL